MRFEFPVATQAEDPRTLNSGFRLRAPRIGPEVHTAYDITRLGPGLRRCATDYSKTAGGAWQSGLRGRANGLSVGVVLDILDFARRATVATELRLSFEWRCSGEP